MVKRVRVRVRVRVRGVKAVPVPSGASASGLGGGGGGVLADLARTAGLTANMRAFLAVRLLHASDRATAEAIGVSLGTPKQWLFHYPAFRSAYDRLMASGSDAAMDMVERLAGKAVAVVESLLDSEEWPARAKGAEMVFRARGWWNSPPTVRDDPATASVVASMAALAALADARRRELEAGLASGQGVQFPATSTYETYEVIDGQVLSDRQGRI